MASTNTKTSFDIVDISKIDFSKISLRHPSEKRLKQVWIRFLAEFQKEGERKMAQKGQLPPPGTPVLIRCSFAEPYGKACQLLAKKMSPITITNEQADQWRAHHLSNQRRIDRLMGRAYNLVED